MDNTEESALNSSDKTDNSMGREVKEKPVNLAGPPLAYKAVNRMRRLQGIAQKEPGIKSKYVPKEIIERIDRLSLELDEEIRREKELEEAKKREEENSLSDDPSKSLKKADLSDKSDISDKNTEISPENSESTVTDSKSNDNTLNLQNNSDDFVITDSYFPKAMKTIDRLNNEKNALLLKIRRNFRLFIIIILAFAGYYAYSVYTSRSDVSSTLDKIRATLPVKLDNTTTLTDINRVENTLYLKVVKLKDSFDGSRTLNEAVDSYAKTASKNFCSIEFFNSLITGGTAVKVELLSEDNSTLKEFTVDKCGK